MKVREIMVRPVVTVHTDIPAKEAAALLARHRITAMPVLDADDAAQVRTQLDAYPGSGMRERRQRCQRRSVPDS